MNEVKLLETMDHPNVVKLYEIFSDNANFFFVTELCKGGELFNEIVRRKRFSEHDAANIVYQILNAVSYFHSRNICHRDLKPENIVIQEGNHIKVIDFGTAQEFNPEDGMSKILGTPFYMAPEVFNRKRYSEKCDMWAIGVIIFILVTGQPPFSGRNDKEIVEQIKEGRYKKKVLHNLGVSKQVINLIEKILVKEPENRLSAQEAIKHPWILKQGVPEVDLFEKEDALENLQLF